MKMRLSSGGADYDAAIGVKNLRFIIKNLLRVILVSLRGIGLFILGF
jgi:hypothetical protein